MLEHRGRATAFRARSGARATETGRFNGGSRGAKSWRLKLLEHAGACAAASSGCRTLALLLQQ
eukprot:6884285-Alexandrium_andersonii.AAC.1